jgi:hypothetical protein
MYGAFFFEFRNKKFGNSFVLAMCSIILFSFLFSARKTDSFLLRGTGNLLFFLLYYGWWLNKLTYRWALVFSK